MDYEWERRHGRHDKNAQPEVSCRPTLTLDITMHRRRPQRAQTHARRTRITTRDASSETEATAARALREEFCFRWGRLIT